MARCPFAAWRPLPQNANAPSITPRLFVYHTNVGASVLSTERYFSGSSGGVESHFGIACPKCEAEGIAKDGAIWQWMDTSKRADAQLDANGFALSVETCDHYKGGTYTNPPLSAAQVNSWIRLGNWAAETHHIPRRRASAWDGSGFGYHSMWGAPSHWTSAPGKTCPNPNRIKQFNDTVLPAIVSGTVPGDDLSIVDTDTKAYLDKQFDAVTQQAQDLFRELHHGDRTTKDLADYSLKQVLAQLGVLVPRTQDILNRVSTTDEILALVTAVQAAVGASSQAVLGALAALDLSLTDEQVAAIAAAVDVDESQVAEAVRFRLADALAA